MAKPVKIKNKNGTTSYRIGLYKRISGKTYRETKTFSTRQLAIDWADKRTAEIEHEAVHGSPGVLTIRDIIERYKTQFGGSYGR